MFAGYRVNIPAVRLYDIRFGDSFNLHVGIRKIVRGLSGEHFIGGCGISFYCPFCIVAFTAEKRFV